MGPPSRAYTMKGWKSKSVDWTTLHRKKEENPRGLNMKTHLRLTKHAPPAPKRQTEYKNPTHASSFLLQTHDDLLHQRQEKQNIRQVIQLKSPVTHISMRVTWKQPNSRKTVVRRNQLHDDNHTIHGDQMRFRNGTQKGSTTKTSNTWRPNEIQKWNSNRSQQQHSKYKATKWDSEMELKQVPKQH